MKAGSCYLRTRCGIRHAFRWVGARLLRSIVLTTALMSLSVPVLARGEPNERQKCKAFGSTLITEHDRLYGPGTGKAFVEGPYASDLPRALKARIRPALKRQAAQFAMVAEAPEPTATAADTSLQVTPPLPPAQSNPVTGTTEPVAIKSPPAAEIAAPPVKSAARDVTVTKSPDENRLDRSTHPSRAYSLAFVAVFAGAALLATGHALGLRIRGFARWRLTGSKPC